MRRTVMADPAPPDADSGDTAWLLTSAALVMLMTPALAFFYGGFVSQTAVVHVMLMSFGALSVVSILWSLFSYSLAFGQGDTPESDPWLGGMQYGAFDSSDKLAPGTLVPEHSYFAFQLQFAIITAAVISGAVVNKVTMAGWLFFSALWHVFVYVPLARWIFYPGGWLAKLGTQDFAGGLVVETASGVSALALAWSVSRSIASGEGTGTGSKDIADAHARTRSDSAGSGGPGHHLLGSSSPGHADSAHAVGASGGHGAEGHKGHEGGHHGPRPHNIPFILLGAGLLYFGWFGFNAGSAISSGYLASRAFVNTHLAAASAMATWALAEIFWGGRAEGLGYGKGRPSPVGCATGVVVGLVGITPACGYVSQMISLLIGFACAIACYHAEHAMARTAVDDRLSCFSGHGVAGMVGTLMIGFFANTNEGSPANGVAYGGDKLLGYQVAGLAVTVSLCLVGTFLCWRVTAFASYLTGIACTVPTELQDSVDSIHHGIEAYGHLTLLAELKKSAATVASAMAVATQQAAQWTSRSSFGAPLLNVNDEAGHGAGVGSSRGLGAGAAPYTSTSLNGVRDPYAGATAPAVPSLYSSRSAGGGGGSTSALPVYTSLT